jgi:uncharacterized protein
METEKLIILGIASFLLSIFSGISGGGAGFITTPLMIFLGLSPQHAIASGKIGGLGVTLGSLKGLTKAKVHRKKPIILLLLLSGTVGLIAPHFITRLDNEIYRNILGILILLLVPVMIYRKTGIKKRTPKKWQYIVAAPVLFITLMLQAVFSGGMGSLVVLTLMTLVGMTALEANVTKRFSQVLMNSLLVLGLLGTGLIIWEVAAVLFACNIVGGYVGAHIAVKKGDKFVTYVIAALMIVSGIGLLIT